MGPRAVLEVLDTRRFSCPCRDKIISLPERTQLFEVRSEENEY